MYVPISGPAILPMEEKTHQTLAKSPADFDEDSSETEALVVGPTAIPTAPDSSCSTKKKKKEP
jgi:hypothetical protein